MHSLSKEYGKYGNKRSRFVYTLNLFLCLLERVKCRRQTLLNIEYGFLFYRYSILFSIHLFIHGNCNVSRYVGEGVCRFVDGLHLLSHSCKFLRIVCRGDGDILDISSYLACRSITPNKNAPNHYKSRQFIMSNIQVTESCHRMIK